MLATTLSADPYLGRILTGRVESGRIGTGTTLKALSRDGERIEQFRVTKILAFRGLSQTRSTRPWPATSSPSPA
jgi:GTP-binding protein